MNASKKCSICLACLLAGWAIAGDSMNGGRFELVGVVTSGASRLAGGNFGVFGVADFGSHVPAAGGSYELVEGVLGGFEEPQVFSLTYEVLVDGSLRLSWPASAKTASLEFTSGLEFPTTWHSVPSTSIEGNSYVAPRPSSALFFRLRSL